MSILKKSIPSMTEGPIFKNVISYTIPIMLSTLLQLAFNAADLIIVGRFCGAISLAAVGATGSITNLLTMFFIGMATGSGVTVAQRLGARDDKTVHKLVHTAIPAAIIFGALLTVVGIIFSGTFLRLMGTPENVLPLSTIYMQIIFGGMIFSMLYNYAAAILRAAGDSRTPLTALTIAGVVNVVLNVIFVTVLNMNVAGVALATIISQAVSALLVTKALMLRTDACRLMLRSMKIYFHELSLIAKIGLPAGIQSSLFGISNVLIQSSVNSFGDVFMSGNAAAGNIEGFVYAFGGAFYQTAMNFIGQNEGAKQYKRMYKILAVCCGCAASIGLTIGILAVAFDEQLVSIYITDSPEAVYWGTVRLLYMCIPYFVGALMDISTGALRGIGESMVPMIISIICVCGFRILWISTIFSMPQFHTPQVLYLSYAISWTLTFAIQGSVFLIKLRKKCKTAEAC